MAVTLTQKFSVDLNTVVANSIKTVQNVRKNEQSRQEAEFQKAVANGMSYAAQLQFRQQQLDKEKESSLVDADFISQLEGSVATTKKLARFEIIRNKYKQSLDDYVSGKESIGQHIAVLQSTMDSEQDPDMRKELRDLISTAVSEKSQNELNAIKNRALVAEKDNSVGLIEGSINEIQNRRSLAAINENEDEVAMWDSTLIALRSSKSKLQIENGLNDITFKVNQGNLKANDKIGLLNDYVAGSDASSPVVYDGVTYPSLKAYWENKRSDYISNSYFGEVKKETDAETSRISSGSAYGQTPVARIQAVNDYYNNMKTRAEFAPFVDKIEQERVSALNTSVSSLAESLYTEGDATGDTAKAQQAILGLESKFGIKVSREPFTTEKKSIAGGTITDTAAVPGATPAPTPTTPTNVATPPATTDTGIRLVKPGDTLSAIARDAGVSLNTLLDLNPDYKTNPNSIRIGAKINLPKVAPIVPPSVVPPTPTGTPPATTPPSTAPTITPPPVPTTDPNQTSGRTFKQNASGQIEVYENGTLTSTTTEDNATKTLGYKKESVVK